MQQTATIKSLWDAVGGLSNPSKMPGWSYGLPAQECKLGSLLRKVEGSTCSGCYAMKGMYQFPVVKAAQARRLAILQNDLGQWTEDMVELLWRKYDNVEPWNMVFRWHDSGDLQSIEHLDAIVQIAIRLRGIRFWLPTRETAIVKAWRREHGAFPWNLTVRVSAAMVGAAGPDFEFTSTVDGPTGYDSYRCPAPEQGNACQDCRACWNRDVPNVDYHKH